MSVRKVNIKVIGVKAGNDEIVHQTPWDGDLGEWIEVGGEAAGVLDEYDEVRVILTPKK